MQFEAQNSPNTRGGGILPARILETEAETAVAAGRVVKEIVTSVVTVRHPGTA